MKPLLDLCDECFGVQYNEDLWSIKIAETFKSYV